MAEGLDWRHGQCMSCYQTMDLFCGYCGLCLNECCHCSSDTDPADTLPG